ncbi:SDR family NAD(P)-dependent oxidoreductase [Rhodococcus koreensis]
MKGEIVARTAVITGGASGIGRRTAERLVAEGWTVWALDISADAPTEQSVPKDAPGRFHYVTCDVADVDSVTRAIEAIRQETDTIDALICSAGVIRPNSLEDYSIEEVDLMLGVNVKGPWLSIREALPLLRNGATTDDPARVVIVGSVGGIRPKVGSGFYAATKAAVHVLAGVFAVELAETGVVVNAVAPGTVATPMVEEAVANKRSSSYTPSGVSPLGRIGQPDDVADVILFFLSDAAKFVNGTVLPVDGGTRAAFVKN